MPKGTSTTRAPDLWRTCSGASSIRGTTIPGVRGQFEGPLAETRLDARRPELPPKAADLPFPQWFSAAIARSGVAGPRPPNRHGSRRVNGRDVPYGVTSNRREPSFTGIGRSRAGAVLVPRRLGTVDRRPRSRAFRREPIRGRLAAKCRCRLAFQADGDGWRAADLW